MIRVLRGVGLFFFFLKELAVANAQVVLLLLSGPGRVRSAIVRVPTDLETEFQLMLLANMITLTPGTLTLEIAPDRKALFVHVIHTLSPEETVASIKSGFERRIREVFA